MDKEAKKKLETEQILAKDREVKKEIQPLQIGGFHGDVKDFMTMEQIPQSKQTPAKVVADQAETRKSSKRMRGYIHKVHPFEVAKAYAIKKAEEIRSSLGPGIPSFIKYLLPSYISCGKSLGLPAQFCHSYLPKSNDSITLIDERGDEYHLNFRIKKLSLSAGWSRFRSRHELRAGDVLVFELVKLKKLKVYIIRGNARAMGDTTPRLLRSDMHVIQVNADKAIKTSEENEGKYSRSISLDVIKDNSGNQISPISKSHHGSSVEQSANESQEVNSEVLEHLKSPGTGIEFKEMNSIENFTIFVNGFDINAEIEKHIQTKYYELCCSQKTILHDHLLQGINYKLVSAIISETVNISEAINDCKLSTSRDNFTTWDKTLEAFELLGMNVGFLRARVGRLVTLSFDSEDASYSKRYREARTGRDRLEEKIKPVESNLREMKDTWKKLNSEIETLKVKAESHEMEFQAEANAPW